MVIALLLVVVTFLPLYAMLSRSFQDEERNFVGFANYIEYFSTPTLVTSAVHTITIGVITTVGGMLFDGSLSAQLQQLRATLTKES